MFKQWVLAQRVGGGGGTPLCRQKDADAEGPGAREGQDLGLLAQNAQRSGVRSGCLHFKEDWLLITGFSTGKRHETAMIVKQKRETKTAPFCTASSKLVLV